jgi:hypothetical protein
MQSAPDNRSYIHFVEHRWHPVSVVLPLVRRAGLSETVSMSDMTQFSVTCDGLSNVPVLIIEIEEEVRNLRPLIDHSAVTSATAPVVTLAISELTFALSTFLDQQERMLRADSERIAQVLKNYSTAEESVVDWMSSLAGMLGITSVSASLGTTVTNGPDAPVKPTTPDMPKFDLDESGNLVMPKPVDVKAKASVTLSESTWFSGARVAVTGKGDISGQTVDYSVSSQAGVYSNSKAEAGWEDSNAFFTGSKSMGAVLQSTAAVSTLVGAVKLEASNTTTIGATAEGQASAKIGLDGLNVGLGAKLFVGGSTETEVSGSWSGVKAAAGVGVSYGLGAHAEGSVSFSPEKIGLKVNLGATLGLGISVKFDVSINPSEVYDAASTAVNNIVKDIDLWPF